MDDRVTNVLIIDDDEVDVLTVKRAFARAEIPSPIYVATNGVEGLEMLRKHALPARRRLVLLDINMPKMNGIEFLRELRADPELQHVCVVALTTSNGDQDRLDAYKLNVAGYLLKPVSFQQFAEVMTTINNYWALMEMP
jgi:CheY-like chemotaxis protein